jgi:hypothetical protein
MGGGEVSVAPGRDRHPTLHRRVVILAAILSAALPASGWTWGGAVHHYIAQNYSQHLPAYIDGLRTYDTVVDQKVTDPDSRKSYTPGESYRHYIDIDAYPAFFYGTLSHDRAALEAQYGASTVLANGVLPWAVGEVVTTLTQQFQAQQWSAAATTIADLCHYVGDAEQPLHCTENYDGQLTGNSGIHSRYESEMMSAHLGDLHTSPMTVAFYPSTLNALFDVITASWSGASTILQADDDARAATGGQFNSTYFASLWTRTASLTRTRIDSATVVTASLVYTAWVNAGRPTVPGSSATYEPEPAAGTLLEARPTPFRDELTIHFAGAGPLNVEIFDVRGARVTRLVAGASGEGTVSWRPAGSGPQVRPGLYFIRLTGPDLNLVRRVTLIGG